MTALLLLPPVIDQTIHRVPIDFWSAFGFAIVGIASLYLGVRRSPLIAAALAFAVPFAAYRDVGHTTLTIEKCIVLGAVLGLLLSRAPLWPQSPGSRRVLLASLAVLATILLSSLNAAFHINVVREFFKQAEYLALFWCAVTFSERVARSHLYFTWGVALSAAIVSTLAVLQALVGGAPSGVWVNGHPLPRVAGPLEGPNQLAGYLEAVLPILWVAPVLMMTWKPIRAYATSASSAALILTQSRAGLLAAAVVYALFWKLRGSVARVSVWATVIGTAFGLIVSAAWLANAGFLGVQRVFLMTTSGPPGGVGLRSQLWPAAIQLFHRHPLFGVGAGNYELLLPTVGLHGIQTHAGSLWLQTLAEQGVVGFLVLVAFAFIVLRETFAMRARTALGLAAFLATVSLLAHQLVDDLFFFPKVAALWWLLLGAGTAQPLNTTSGQGDGKLGSVIDFGDRDPTPLAEVVSRALPLTD